MADLTTPFKLGAQGINTIVQECDRHRTPTTLVLHRRQAGGHSYRAPTSDPDPSGDRNGGETRRQRKQHRSDDEEESREVIQGGTEPSSLGPTTLPRCTTVLYSTILCLIPAQ
uniref:Protein E4 n=1 Tax=Haemonchus contortus TaxID=6289 RepID=A0A7I5E9X3_HAECO